MKAKESLERAMLEYLSGKSVAEADETAISIIEKYGQECFRAGVEAMRDIIAEEVERFDEIWEVNYVLKLAEKLLTEEEKELGQNVLPNIRKEEKPCGFCAGAGHF